jgi:hypothetical protein
MASDAWRQLYRAVEYVRELNSGFYEEDPPGLPPLEDFAPLLAVLPRRERKVIETRWQLWSDRPPMSLEETGKSLGYRKPLSRERVRSIEGNALRRLAWSGQIPRGRPRIRPIYLRIPR